MCYMATPVMRVATWLHVAGCAMPLNPLGDCDYCTTAAEHALAVVEGGLIGEVHSLHAADEVGYGDGLLRVVCVECGCAYPCPTVVLLFRYEGGRP